MDPSTPAGRRCPQHDHPRRRSALGAALADPNILVAGSLVPWSRRPDRTWRVSSEADAADRGRRCPGCRVIRNLTLDGQLRNVESVYVLDSSQPHHQQALERRCRVLTPDHRRGRPAHTAERHSPRFLRPATTSLHRTSASSTTLTRPSSPTSAGGHYSGKPLRRQRRRGRSTQR